ncbi:MAG: two-component system response regulator [Anaerolineae bacterium]
MPAEQSPALSGGHYNSSITGREPELSGLRAKRPPLVVHVDDDPDLLTLVRHVLEMSGYRVKSFKSGERALAYLRCTEAALLITDLMRPELDGLALCGLIRDEPRLAELPVIVFSAVHESAAKQLEPFNVTFLRKPCTWQAIVETVNELVKDDEE